MYEFRNTLRLRLLRLARLRGLTLVEFMVAITIGIFIALGMLILMSRTSRSYKINDEFARLQEGGADGVRYLGDDIHMAGFYGLAVDPTTMQTFATNGVNLDYGSDTVILGTTAGPGNGNLVDCGTANWSFQTAIPVAGVAPGPAGVQPVDPISTNALKCINPANFAGGPVLILRGAQGTMINGTTVTVNATQIKQPQNWSTPQFSVAAGSDPNLLYTQADPFIGFVFVGNKYSNYRGAAYTRSVPLGAGFVDAPIYQYQSRIYYVRGCSRPSGGADAMGNPVCQGAGKDDLPNPFPVPSLVRQEWQSGPVLRETTLVEGVEQMGVLYGYDNLSAAGNAVACSYASQCDPNSPDGVADSYSATPPTAANTGQVVTVRLNLLIRAPSPTAGYDDSVKTYDLGGAVFWNCVTAGAPCNYHRHIFTQQIQVKNSEVRRGGGA
jgi:type II secretory pathway pseudopilin PulG